MRCEEVRETVADYLAEDLPLSDEIRVAEHLRVCASCRVEFEELKSVWTDLGDIPVPRVEATTLWPPVETAISEIRREPLNATKNEGRFEMWKVLRVAAIVLVLVGMAAGAGLILKQREPEQGSTQGSSRLPLADMGHVRGKASAPMTLVEYGDYECPPCLVYHDVVRNVLQKYPDAIKYEYRHFPLTGPHPNALAASLAAEAAGEQGRYWEMHDLLRSSQAEWRRKPEARRYFAGLAKQIGLDIAVFERSMDSSVVEEKILNDAKRAQAAGVEAVPRFYVDGQPLEGGYTPEALEAILLSMIRTRLGLGTN